MGYTFVSQTYTHDFRIFSSVAVISDQLFITVASLDRLEKFKKLYDQSIANGAAVEQVSAVQIAQIGVNGMGFDGAPALPIREEMIKAMCQFSGMIPPFSEKCLADCAWNFDVC